VRDLFFDRGAIFAGWVGVGMAVVVAICFELIIPVQVIVFLLAPVMGFVIGVYANVRAERWRPRGRVIANALYAGAVTALTITVFYVAVRLVFIYGDGGSLPDGSSLQCRTGPDCVYQRLLLEEQRTGHVGDLAAEGIVDAASLEEFAWRGLATTGASLFLLTVAGSLVGGVARTLVSQPGDADRRAPLVTAGSAPR
jgi:hypothetical protein